MSLVLNDRVQETANAPGTGAVSLLGAVTGFQTFSAGVGNGNTCYYCIADQGGSNWEVGVGTYSSSGNTLARTTPLSGSSTTPVNFSSGTQTVFVTYPAEKVVIQSENGNVGIGTSSPGQPLTVAGVIETTSGGVKFPDGTTQTTAASAIYTRVSFVATAGQTTFSVSYTPNYATVYLNGVLLAGADYTATSGTSIVLASAASSGDIVEVIAFTVSTISAGTATTLLGGSSGQVAYQSAPNTTSFVSAGTSGQAFISNGTSAPSWGTLGISSGGTGQTTANEALNAFLPTQSGNNGKALITDGTNTSWGSAGITTGKSIAMAMIFGF